MTMITDDTLEAEAIGSIKILETVRAGSPEVAQLKLLASMNIRLEKLVRAVSDLSIVLGNTNDLINEAGRLLEISNGYVQIDVMPREDDV